MISRAISFCLLGDLDRDLGIRRVPLVGLVRQWNLHLVGAVCERSFGDGIDMNGAACRRAGRWPCDFDRIETDVRMRFSTGREDDVRLGKTTDRTRMGSALVAAFLAGQKHSIPFEAERARGAHRILDSAERDFRAYFSGNRE